MSSRSSSICIQHNTNQNLQVNRLTRELTALRAQSASVASNTSHSSNSTSASLLPNDITDPNPTHQMMGGATHPTPSRHRSSSSLSARSGTGSTHAHAGSTAPSHPGSHGGFSQASYDRAAAATGGTTSTTISRQPSISAQSGASTPARQSLDAFRHPSTAATAAGGIASGGTPYTLPHRPSLSRDHSYAASTTATAGTPHHGPQSPPTPAQSPSPNVQIAMQHYTDTAAYRSEMELVKAENDSLRQRVRALEQALRTRRRDSSTSQADSRAPDAAAMMRATTRERELGGGGGTSPSASSPNFTTTTTTSAAAAGIAAWAAGNGGVRGVAGPRERSESQSTTASSRRGLVGGGVYVGEDEVRFGESAGNVGIGR
jgi:hypothetical protein